MPAGLEGNAIVYCQGAFESANGKTAHGLVRRSGRYRVLSVVDSGAAGHDAGQLLDGRPAAIPILSSIEEAAADAQRRGTPASHLVVGLAPDGGRLAPADRAALTHALDLGLNLVSGLHDFLSEDPTLAAMASQKGLTIYDVRKPPPASRLHFFSGKIEEVACFKLAVLGSDSALGKRTTCWLLCEALDQRGLKAEMVGTGQTAWLQGVRYGVIMDSLVNDFVSGEIEHAVWSAWQQERPQVILVEGQGSLMNPAYPGGFEILAAARPDAVVMQHAPARRDYDGFPGYPIHPLPKQIQAVELLADRPVVAVTLNHEGLDPSELAKAAREISRTTGLPAWDLLRDGPGELAELVAGLAGEKLPAS